MQETGANVNIPSQHTAHFDHLSCWELLVFLTIIQHYHRPGVHYESHNYREEYRHGPWTPPPGPPSPMLANSPIKTSTDFSLLFLLSSPAPPAPAPAPSQYTTQQEFHDTRIHHHDTRVEIDTRHHEHLVNPIDKIERQYRQRFQPTYHKEEVTVETYPAPHHHHHHHSHSDHHSDHHSHHQHSHVDEYTVESERPRPQQYKETITVTEETIEPTHVSKPQHKSSKMGYYDDDGHYHSFRQGLHKLADKIAHPHHHHHHHHGHADRYEVSEVRAASAPRRQSSGSGSGAPRIPNTVTIPCHHIRLGDFLMLQGRPCQVIKISTSAATGQYRYLGVDLFTKQLHEESSFIANPAPSVVVQTMLGPVFKQYRVLDLSDGHVTAMTETGDVKQGLPVIDQSDLWSRLNNAFESGRGSVRVLVLNDAGRELAVDVKVIHGSRL
ncbi:woronin body major protein [Colletotrichum lupini]|uniref:Woronin body major protein n=1 Tax=Colletotrichum lupini TaxID=145971 RepID=A0A9Q8ST81_9PEZI|nr:woronin body major protein [Colletotrichum lupini]UQC83023.1 woronin body major protein [Colletotrichum lupini]